MSQLPIPDFFDVARVGEIWKVDYAARADQANFGCHELLLYAGGKSRDGGSNRGERLKID